MVEAVAFLSQSSPKRTKTPLGTILAVLDDLSAHPLVRRIIYWAALIFFVVIVLIPPIAGVVLKLGLLTDTLHDPSLILRVQSAIAASFIIAFLVSLLDLVAGIPTAWFIVRRKSRWASVVDTLADIPFVIPTVALGFSVLIFWSQPGGLSSLLRVERLVSPGVGLVMLLHFAFSYPIIVRLMVGELQGYDQVYETASRTLGASPLTAARTVTLPIMKPALVSAFLLAFCRSLSETGATAVVAGIFENGPLLIRNARAQGQEGPMVLVSAVLIISSCLIFAVISLLGPRLRLPTKKVWPHAEKNLSSPKASLAKDSVSLAIFGLFVAIPSLFVILPASAAFADGTIVSALSGSGVWGAFWSSLVNSYVLGISATLMNLTVGFPMAVMIARRRLGPRFTALLDALISVPITIPSVALGVSLGYFWAAFGNLPEFWVLILVHTTITYTYFVRTMSAAIESIPPELEEVGRTLGGRPFETFRKIVLPLSKYSIFSGAVLVLTRSIDETGATVAVAKEIKTAPVLLVQWIQSPNQYSQSTVSLGVLLLVLTAFVSLFAIRLALRRSH